MKAFIATVLIFTLIALLTSPTAWSAELTLDNCIELALKNRASIIAALGAEKIASSNKRAALGAFMPRIGADYSYAKSKDTHIKFEQDVAPLLGIDSILVESYMPDSTGLNPDTTPPVWAVFSRPIYGQSTIHEFESPDQDRSSKNLSFSARMSIFEPANWFNYAAARADHARARLDVLASEQDLIYSVKVAYFAYLASVENISVQEEAVRRAEEQLKLIESRYELGSASLSEVLKQKVQHGNDRLGLLRARNAVTNSRAVLAYTIGVDPRQDHEFSPSYESREYRGTLEDAIDFGLAYQPGLLSAGKSVDAARHSVRAAKSAYLPTLSGWASYSFTDGTRGDTVTFDQSSRSRTIGFSVSYNIFDGFFRESRVTQAKVAYNNGMARLADMRNEVVSYIKTGYHDVEQIKEQKSVADENVMAANEDLKITQEKYRLGAATILDLLDAQVSLKTAQVSLIQADFDLNLAIARLENAMGKM